MKGAIVVCFLALVTVAVTRPNDEKYTAKYDGINLSEILLNPRLIKGYIDCILDKGKCTTEAKELKSHLKEAMENDCAKCTEVQRKGSERVIAHLINHEAAAWEELKAKYDPTGIYAKKHEAELKAAKA